MDKIMQRIMDAEKWPSISYPDNLEIINEMADNSFALGTFEGRFASMLIYHQIIEAMCMHLIDDCHFFIQLSIYPTMIEFKISDNKMLGHYVEELKNSIDFDKKADFIKKIKDFNSMRNRIVHGMTKVNLNKFANEISYVKFKFDNIFELYDDIQDYFRLTFHGFKKDTFIDYLEEDGSDN
ncbi:MAG: hypothetical protein ACYDEX_26010 [Mobilitalea sp.]